MGKKWIVIAACAVSVFGFAGFVGYDYLQMREEYKEVWETTITQDVITGKPAEIKQLETKLAMLESELVHTEEVTREKEKLLEQSLNPEQQKKQILTLYEQNVKLVEEAKLLVMEGLGYEVSAYYADENYEDEWRNNVIGDLAGNSLVGEAVIGGLDAAEKEMSLESIVSGVREGLANGVPSFTTDTLTDMLAGDTGSGVVGAASLITDIFSVNEVPEAIANALVYAQERYSVYLNNFVADEQVTTEDIRWAADSYYQVYLIRTQIADATGGGAVDVSEAEEIYLRLKELAEEYQANNEYLLLYTKETVQ